ncbi:MAG TPA: DoxX family membrane protein [Thermoplasmata archaeon]|nr:DoxX family membrane protein [Thermoplasmata archaeon]
MTEVVGGAGASLGASTWWVRNAQPLKTLFRLLLGVAWLTDGILKFTSGFVDNFLSSVQNSQANAPGWLSGWFSFWADQANGHATTIVYTVGILELLLGLALVFGLMRKIAYVGGVVLSLLIWAVPEGFGGPYQTGSGGTDIGTGVIYAIAFLGLILINATYGPSRYSLDFYIERRVPKWSRIAEFGDPPSLGKAAMAPGPESAA